ncbi:hypothetical protein HII36_39650 [Nonomuraea sp. NN258]|uniref:hypothetical protein n=1 Tax=Nonomuraea antri TaxID=2730852 RepID=UPI001567D3FF|nr:hypothetical protein [Nonomuraea antri]NRQ37903.1 hypothetical protein [Nonomuraea antri]
MPSVVHDTLNTLFRNRPELAVELLQHVYAMDFPPHTLVEVAGSDFNDRPSQDFQADTVVLVGPRQEPVHGVIVEVQRDRTDEKRKAWTRYAAALWLRLDKPVTLLAICPDAGTAAWASEPIETELARFTLQPRVIGPDQIPAIDDAAYMSTHPELAALSVMAHGDRPAVTNAFVKALVELQDEHAAKYYEYAYNLSAPIVRQLLEEIMTKTTDWPVYSPFAREHYGKGLTEGQVKGRAEGEAEALLAVLEARNLAVNPEVKARIAGCKDAQQLDKWVRRAATAHSIDEIFD